MDEVKDLSELNIKEKKYCRHIGCNVRPTYGLIGTKIALYCFNHKLAEHVDVRNKTCNYLNCKKQPTYGIIGTKIALYCVNHKLENYVNVKDKTCNYLNCKKQPTYGLIGTKIALYCANHKLENYVDVRSKRCIHPNCKTLATYGIKGYSRTHCSNHKTLEMVLQPTKYKDADYNACDYCAIKILPDQKYCTGCKNYISTGKTVKRHLKELAVKTLLDEHKVEFTHDLIVKDGCSKKRPDFVIKTIWGTIILEVDEHQHNKKTYSCECEITRMKQIYFDCGENNLLFIRYNPDEYKTISNKEDAINIREDFLIRFLNSKIESTDDQLKGLNVIYLYYDGFEKTAVDIEKINPY